jgi:carbonyl reductase 1
MNSKVSKVGISALTRIHQRQFDQDPREDLTVNCVHPGYVVTDATYQKGEKTIQEGQELVHLI